MIRVSLPTAPRERVVPLTVPQVLALADAVPARYRAMVLTQAGLGLRIGELLGLRLADIDFLRRTVRIEHQSHAVTRALVPPKTESSRRGTVNTTIRKANAKLPADAPREPELHITSHDLRHHFASVWPPVSPWWPSPGTSDMTTPRWCSPPMGI
ncbi:MAG: tyrosine-type recombinase/integrase [Pseudonocardiaceae bacterium]